jgi:hypothetical protein
MTIKVYKFADIVGNNVVLSGQRRPGDAAAILVNLEEAHDPIPESSWTLDLVIGEGLAARSARIDLAPMLRKSDPQDSPVFLKPHRSCLIYFRKRIFISERMPMSALELEEVTLRVKKATYDEEVEISSLRAAVANLEATIEFHKSGPKRTSIGEDVKLLVWARDGGSCVYCGSRQDLHFDHIIPVAKGGGNTQENIQLLCQPCNLTKSDKIAIA